MILVNAVRRVFAAPWAWLGLWLLQVATVATFSATVYGAVSAIMTGRAWLDDGHRLVAIGELLSDNPAVGAAAVTAVLASAAISFVLWIVASGGVITRLSGIARGREAVANIGRHLPEMFVQSIWGLLGRAVLLGIAAVGANANPKLGIVLFALFLPLSALAMDATRVLAVFHPESRYHPRLYWRALTTSVRRPKAWLGAIVLTALQLAASLVILELGFADRLGANTLPALRVLALVPLFFALCRVGLAIETFVPPRTDDAG